VEKHELENYLHTFRSDVLQQKLDIDEGKRRLAFLVGAVFKDEISSREFVSVMLDILDNAPPSKIRDILQSSLGVAYIHHEDNRIVSYWERILNDGDKSQKEAAVWELHQIANRGNDYAHNVLMSYLGQRPIEDTANKNHVPLNLGEKKILSELEEKQKRKMAARDLKQYLENLQKKISEKEFFSVIIDLSEKNTSEEELSVLQSLIIAHAHCDRDRAALYWKQFLSNKDAIQRERSAYYLFMLKDQSQLAYQFLKEYWGQEPTDVVLKSRLLKLFPDNE